MRKNYLNKKAQTLTELASFGTVLLLVISFLVSYGLRYNYQQDAQLRAFRMALSDAYNNVSRPDAMSTVTLIEDRHIPDPRDRFAIGSVVPVQSGAQVVWGNTMQDGYEDTTDYSRVQYVINGQKKEYTTEAYITIHQSCYAGFYADILDERQYITWDKVTCYQPTPDAPRLARVSLGNNKSELIGSIYLPLLSGGCGSGIVAGKVIAQNLPIIGVIPATAANGDALVGFNVRSPQGGAINPYYTQLNQNTGEFNGTNSIYVTPENMQGLLPFNTLTKTKREDSLKLDETSSKWKSTENFDLQVNITRQIRKNAGGIDPVYSDIARSASGKVLETAK